MRLAKSILVAGGVLLMSFAASAQYQPPRDRYDQGSRDRYYQGSRNRYYQDSRDGSYRDYRGYRYQTPLPAIENTLAANGVSTNSMQSADQWNYYARETFPGFVPPSPEALFPQLANVESSVYPYQSAVHDPVSFQSWWNAIQPYLQGSTQ